MSDPNSSPGEAAPSDSSAPRATPEWASAATCRCGHGVGHYMVSPDCQYDWWGWIRVSFLGISTRPILVRYRCRACREVIWETDDPAEIERHTYI